MMHFTALGDSVTVGLGDRLPSGNWRGWATLLADSLGDVTLHNLARCGARIDNVATEQLPRALAARPTIASVIVGMNDTLRGSFNLVRFARGITHVLEELTRTGALVLTARLPDPGRVFGAPELVSRPLVRRIHAINAVIDDLAVRHGTIHIDITDHPGVYNREMWGVDRLHPSERGHRLLARLFAEELAVLGIPMRALPDTEPTNPPPTAAERVIWLATKGTAWLARRSRDFLPTLVSLTAREWWYARHHRTIELDERLCAELRALRACL